MRNRLLIIFSILCLTSYAITSLSTEEDHDHSGEEKHEDHKTEAHDEHTDHDVHADEKEHTEDEHGDEHGHKDEEGHDKEADHDEHGDHGEEEAPSGIGPDKGITEKSEHGFKLSVEAVKTMEIQMKPVGSLNFLIDKNTLVLVKDVKSVFRVRDGWIKRVPVKILSKSNGMYSISSESLRNEDQIIVHGIGFLRVAEIVVTEGATSGHSH